MAHLETVERVSGVVTGVAGPASAALPPDRLGSPSPIQELAAGEAGRFVRIVRITRDLLSVDAVGIEVLDHHHRWSSSGFGKATFDSAAVHGLCGATMQVGDQFVLEDVAADGRFGDLPSDIGFFAAHPLTSISSGATGVLWVAGAAPRTFDEAARDRLRDLAKWVSEEAVDSEELTRSRQVQRALLPKSFATLDGYDVAGGSSAKRAVGGDFYDWYPVRHGAAFTIGDVMGKGMPAALIATTVRAVMRAGSRSDGVAAAAEAAEETLDADLSGASTFVTLFHSYLDEETGVLRYIDAGHGLSLVVHTDGSSERLSSNSLPLGAGANSEWRAQTVRLHHGSTLVSFSDGVLDLFDGTLGAMDEVETIVRGAPTAQAVIDSLMARVDSTVTDDVTVIAVRRTPSGSDWD